MAFEEQVRPQISQINSIFERCIDDAEVCTALTKALHLITRLEQILGSINNQQEFAVYTQALQEVQYSLLSVSIGNYRHAYSSLRLFFELSLAAIEFSANKRYFRGWVLGREDIFWARITDGENGVLSRNFCTLFFSELADEAPHFKVLAGTVYRECSEFVHGNPRATSTLPDTLEFKKETVLDWANKLDSMNYVLTFVFAVRYLTDLPSNVRENIKDDILALLGHFGPIREILGGSVGG